MQRGAILLLGLTISAIAAPTPLEFRKANARALLERKDFAAALKEARAVNQLAADDLTGYQMMAAALLELGDYDEAEVQLDWMLQLRIGKADFEGWMLIARFREITGDVEGALEAVNLAHAQAGTEAARERQSAMSYAAWLQYGNGKLDLAFQAVERAGGDPKAQEVLARIRIKQGNRTEAIRILRSLTKKNSDPRLLYLLAETTEAAADYAAFERGATAITAAADNANNELTLYYAGRGKQPSRALEIARAESRLRHDVFTLDALATALFANGQTAEARATMRRVLATGTRDTRILEHAARIGVER